MHDKPYSQSVVQYTVKHGQNTQPMHNHNSANMRLYRVFTFVMRMLHFLPCMAGYGRIWPGMARYGRIWPDMARYGQMWPDMARYGQIWPDMARYGRIWPDMARYGQIWLDMARYGRIWPDIARYGQIWPDMARYGRIWPDMARYGQIWPDITIYAQICTYWMHFLHVHKGRLSVSIHFYEYIANLYGKTRVKGSLAIFRHLSLYIAIYRNNLL